MNKHNAKTPMHKNTGCGGGDCRLWFDIYLTLVIQVRGHSGFALFI